MMIVLLVVGAALIAFGGVVLMKYSDRPGGSIKALGAEVSSAGAGLPLIALGVGCVAWAATHWQQTPSVIQDPAPTPREPAVVNGDTSCFARLFAPAAGRVDTLEIGMGAELIGAHEKLDPPFAVVLTENGARIGALRARLYRGPDTSSDLYKVEQVVDAKCSPVSAIKNISRGGDPNQAANWDTIRIGLGDHNYELRFGGIGNINLTTKRAD